MNIMIKLQPCPFCGGEVSIIADPGPLNLIISRIKCPTCGLQTGKEVIQKDLIAKWDRMINKNMEKNMNIHEKIIIGQEAITPDGLGRVIAYSYGSPSPWIQVSTYINGSKCKWDHVNVELINPRRKNF